MTEFISIPLIGLTRFTPISCEIAGTSHLSAGDAVFDLDVLNGAAPYLVPVQTGNRREYAKTWDQAFDGRSFEPRLVTDESSRFAGLMGNPWQDCFKRDEQMRRWPECPDNWNPGLLWQLIEDSKPDFRGHYDQNRGFAEDPTPQVLQFFPDYDHVEHYEKSVSPFVWAILQQVICLEKRVTIVGGPARLPWSASSHLEVHEGESVRSIPIEKDSEPSDHYSAGIMSVDDGLKYRILNVPDWKTGGRKSYKDDRDFQRMAKNFARCLFQEWINLDQAADPIDYIIAHGVEGALVALGFVDDWLSFAGGKWRWPIVWSPRDLKYDSRERTHELPHDASRAIVDKLFAERLREWSAVVAIDADMEEGVRKLLSGQPLDE